MLGDPRPPSFRRPSEGHFWEEIQVNRDGSPHITPDQLSRFKDYNKSIPKYVCQRCGVMASLLGPNPQDRDCNLVLIGQVQDT
jgi:hypothetical protein